MGLAGRASSSGDRCEVQGEKPSGFPDADLYQLLAYCTALRLPDGHLVYAQGNEAGRTHHVPGAGVTLHAHTLDLDQPPAGLLAQVDALAATLASTTTTSSVAASA